MDKVSIKKSDSIQVQKEKLKSLQPKGGGLDAKKYSGVIKVKEEPVQYQKKVREEWDESSS